MKRLGRIARRLALALLAILVLVAVIVYIVSAYWLGARYDIRPTTLSISSEPAALDRGRHLAEDVTGCNGCHGSDYGGHMFFDGGGMVARLPAANLTRGTGGIADTYTDADWIRAIRHGVGTDGRPLIFMPSADFALLTADDLAALIAYLKSRPPVNREWPKPTVGPVGRALIVFSGGSLLPVRGIDHARPIATAAPDDLVARGDQLTSIGGCKGCHSPDFSGGSGPPPGASNLTPVGIGSWSETDFVRTVRTGVTPDGRELDPVMPRAQMTDEELHAIWSYLKTVPNKGRKTARQAGMP